MDIRKIKKLIQLVEASNITELEISEGQESVRISRLIQNHSQNLVPQDTQSIVSESKKQHQIFTDIKKSSDSLKSNDAIVTDTNEHIIKSPMVGIFYRTLSPESKPFVEIGQKVIIGDTLCIVEAMKMMNQIKTDHSGTIKKILIEHGQAVEFDEPLLIISK